MSVQNPILIQFVTNVTNQTLNEPTVSGPMWDFQGTSGDCEPGKFVTNAATAAATTMIQVSGENVMGSDASYLKKISGQIQFQNLMGEMVTFEIASISPDDEGCIWIGVAGHSGDLTWGGRYVIAAMPGT